MPTPPNYTVITRTGCNKYTITNSHVSANYNIAIANINGDIMHTWNVNGYLNIQVQFTIDGIYILTATDTDIVPVQFLIWSTCNIWKCIQRLTTKTLCAPRGRCEQYTEKRQKERDELNRIMMLYGQFSMMNDQDRYDYLPLRENTDILNNMFDKLNIITRRCGTCCKEKNKKGRGIEQDRFAHDGAYDKDLEDNLPFEMEDEPCSNCEEQYSDEHECPEKVTENIILTGATFIS